MARLETSRAGGGDMTAAASAPAVETEIAARLDARAAANAAFFLAESGRIAALCEAMADRFTRGGRLLAVGSSPAARSDARHVAVEFMHPVIVGKRALPAIGLAGSGHDVAEQLGSLARPDDMVMVFDRVENASFRELAASVASCRQRGCLTIAFERVDADVQLMPPIDDPFARQECVETLYHILWELVHVFFEHTSLRLDGDAHPGRSAFLYPFLGDATHDGPAILRDVSASAVAKAHEINELRSRMLDERGRAALALVVRELGERLAAGGVVLALGNGGSATDAMDLVADLRTPPRQLDLLPHRAIDLTDDSAILTALANDVGEDVVFARQVAALARGTDVVVAFSTSGSSRNVIAGLDGARRIGALTVAFTGYDGGEIRRGGHADHVINAPSEYTPRIQEAHATGYHILRSLLG